MLVEEVEPELREVLRRQPMPPRVLLDKLRLLDENSRKTSQYQDPNYLPFYYHLSKFFSPRRVMGVGLDLGLPLCCFLAGCRSADGAVLFQRRDRNFYSPRIAMSNIKDIAPRGFVADYHYGLISDAELDAKMSPGFDMVLLTGTFGSDEVREMLEVCWGRMRLDGILVADRVNSDRKVGEVFRDFCKVQNRPCIVFDTRYGNGITQK